MFVPIRHATIIAQAKPATIRQWAKRGKITTRTIHGHIHYRIADLIELEAQTRERETRRPAA